MSGDDRTEQATPKKRQDARQKGQTARSPEVSSAALFLAFALTLPLLTSWSGGRLIDTMKQGVVAAGEMRFSADMAIGGMLAAVPILALSAFIAVVANMLQVGIAASPKALMPNLDRINPVNGFKRLLSVRSAFEILKALFKFLLISYVAYRAALGSSEQWLSASRLPFAQAVGLIGQAAHAMLVKIGFAWLALALADYLFQRWQFEKSIKMTKHEVKEEYKQSEGDPHMRGMIKQKMTKLAMRRMIQDVRRADALVTNPTTFAVALRYDSASMRAPKVIAKGKGPLAARIRAEAELHRVPIIANPPLARSLYAGAEVGDEIPVNLYEAVAEVLAYVYRLRHRA
ncbi:MAG: flagellar biosynthesis protein FlhB [Armatimonadetes bacterium]|nr:flagellar biosynthesis protein FlhB [Armatimonadota bacterium]